MRGSGRDTDIDRLIIIVIIIIMRWSSLVSVILLNPSGSSSTGWIDCLTFTLTDVEIRYEE